MSEDVIVVLTRDHNEVKGMLSSLESGPSAATGATPEQLEERKTLVQDLIIELSKHEAAEEQYLWPTVRECLSNGDELADRAIGQEQEGKEALEALRKMKPDAPDFESKLASTIADLREHIATEEEIFPHVSRALSRERLEELGDKIQTAKKMAPTRPHPNAPDSPGALKMAGAVAGPMDRLRDAVTGRGKRDK